MLQDIRKHIQGTTAKIVVGLIVISFAFFGIQSILVGGGGNEIASVNGDDIYPQDLQQALDTQKRRIISMMGENLDPAGIEDASRAQLFGDEAAKRFFVELNDNSSANVAFDDL